MGQTKQLLPLGECTVIRRCLNSIISSGIKDIIVVIGRNSKAITEEIENLPVRIAINTIPDSEMAESVRVGIKMIKSDSTGVLICLSDHPLVSADTLKKLYDKHIEDPDRILIPNYHGRRGHPSLFPKNILKDILEGLNLREIINRYSQKTLYIDVSDEGVVLDMDTIEDYKEMLKRIGEC